MLSQDDIDAVLMEAQNAVDALTEDEVNSPPRQSAPPAGPGAAQPARRSVDGPTPRTSVPSSGSAVLSGQRLQRILRLKVPVVVRLAERPMLLNEIMKIMPGKILEFTRMVDEELDLMVNNRQIGGGVAVKVGERFGLKVTYIGDVKARIESLGGG